MSACPSPSALSTSRVIRAWAAINRARSIRNTASSSLWAWSWGSLTAMPAFSGKGAEEASMAADIAYWPLSRSRSEEHTSELQSLMRISYAVFCLKKNKTDNKAHITTKTTRLQSNIISQIIEQTQT